MYSSNNWLSSNIKLPNSEEGGNGNSKKRISTRKKVYVRDFHHVTACKRYQACEKERQGAKNILTDAHFPKNIEEDFMEWMMQRRYGKPSKLGLVVMQTQRKHRRLILQTTVLSQLLYKISKSEGLGKGI
ncbi:hypothetical protein Tco_1440033 [Tanacetum coccineum]